MTSNQIVYRHFTRDQLDWQYNNLERVPDCADIMESYAARGEAFIKHAPHHFDLSFGDTPAEVVDVYPAYDASDPAPVVVYFHGGYWFSRHKDDFRFIPAGLAPAGAMVVVVNYALVPDVDLAELIRQCQAAVSWTYKNAAIYGGDPERIFLAGHSAGGHITAIMYAADWARWGVPTDAFKGGMAISGLYDLEPFRLNFLNSTLGFTEQTVKDFSPVNLSPTVSAPLVFAVGGAETPEFHRQNKLLVDPWGEAGLATEELFVPDLNHFTVLENFSTEGMPMNTRIRTLMGL